MKTGKSSYIEVTKESQAKLAKVFKCTPKMVYLSLTYGKNTDLAKKIRFTAVSQYGGKAMAHCPECETIHDITEDGRSLMVQYFDNGVKLEIDKQTGEAVIYGQKGEIMNTRQIKEFAELSEIQIYAESL